MARRQVAAYLDLSTLFQEQCHQKLCLRVLPMHPDRRSFLRLSAAAAGGLAFSSSGTLSSLEAAPYTGTYRGLPDVPAAPRSRRLLVLGGTGFIGPHQIRYAVARGHRVTTFNRGVSEAELPPEVEQITGDRNTSDLGSLRGRSWDVVLDNPTTLPFWVRDVGQMLHESTDQYLFISTLSVYDTAGQTEIHEDSPRLGYPDGDPLEVTPEAYQARSGGLYGPMKAASEDEALRWFGEDRTTIVRPGLIVGPGDRTDRFTYWPVRIARGGEILAPGTGHDPVQIIDVRDLMEWTVRLAEEGITGTFNGTGPRSTLTMAEQLHGIRAALPGDLDLRFTWVPAEFLAEQEVRPWSEMTTWFGPEAAISRARIERAVEAGLTFRPLATTAADTLEWFQAQPSDRRELRAGLDPEKEQRALLAWRNTPQSSAR